MAGLLALLGGLAFFGVHLGGNGASFGATAFTSGQVQVTPMLFVNGFSAGANQQFLVDGNGLTTIGANGSALTNEVFGSCTIFAYATTIAATSTGDVDCQAGASALTAIAGIKMGDAVFASLSTSTPTTVGGLVLESVSASTTSGYIHMKILNLTGTTFTWTAAASSSVKFLSIR